MHVLVAIYSPTDVWTIPASFVDVLRAKFPGVTFAHARDERELVELIPQADVVFSSVLTPGAFAAATRLRWVHSPAAGVGGMLFPAMRDSDVIVTNARGMTSVAVAEHALALMLSIWRRIPEAVRAQRATYWMQAELSRQPTLRGRTLGLVGLGAIGTEVARMAAGLGMRVIATRRDATAPLPPGVSEVLPPGQLATLLAQSDVVVLAAPLTRETRGMIGATELAQMKPTALLVNVARGKLVDQTALVAALRAGSIGGAALDVFEHEPLQASSPLWKMPNVLLTPHVAGFREDYWEAATEMFAQNLARFIARQPLVNVVEKHAGY